MFLTSILKIIEPSSYSEADQHPYWIAVMQHQFQALEDNNTWSVISLPPGKQAIECNWMFKSK